MIVNYNKLFIYFLSEHKLSVRLLWQYEPDSKTCRKNEVPYLTILYIFLNHDCPHCQDLGFVPEILFVNKMFSKQILYVCSSFKI